MSHSQPYSSDWSTSGSNHGMSQYDSSVGGDTPEPVEYIAPNVANREEKAVTRSKILVSLVLLLAVSGAATAVFLLMESEERNDFEAAVSYQLNYVIRINYPSSD
eukprot:scaffold1477_cov94-Cylindrotheca_fusiformis.AAC.3